MKKNKQTDDGINGSWILRATQGFPLEKGNDLGHMVHKSSFLPH